MGQYPSYLAAKLSYLKDGISCSGHAGLLFRWDWGKSFLYVNKVYFEMGVKHKNHF